MENKYTVDMVYLWCDSEDEKFFAEKMNAAKKFGHPIDEKCRYKSNDELKYSLRSLERYAGWINKIYIVTNNQKPEWLNLNNNKIKIIDHREIIPKDALPTFNSNAIEHCIANINGLSEYFLLSCDDMFFKDYVNPDFFYAENGYPIFRFSGKLPDKLIDRDLNNYTLTLYNSASLIKKYYNNIDRLIPHHNIDAYRKSDIINCKKQFDKYIDKTIHNCFRTDDDIERVIYHLFACVIGHGHIKMINRKRSLIEKLQRRYKMLDSETFCMQSRRLETKIRNRKAKLFCVNDGEEVTDENRESVKVILQNLFPDKSEFELY